jgi:hypothetical protein
VKPEKLWGHLACLTCHLPNPVTSTTTCGDLTAAWIRSQAIRPLERGTSPCPPDEMRDGLPSDVRKKIGCRSPGSRQRPGSRDGGPATCSYAASTRPRRCAWAQGLSASQCLPHGQGAPRPPKAAAAAAAAGAEAAAQGWAARRTSTRTTGRCATGVPEPGAGAGLHILLRVRLAPPGTAFKRASTGPGLAPGSDLGGAAAAGKAASAGHRGAGAAGLKTGPKVCATELSQVADDCNQAPREPKDSDWRTVCKGEARRCKVRNGSPLDTRTSSDRDLLRELALNRPWSCPPAGRWPAPWTLLRSTGGAAHPAGPAPARGRAASA